VVTTLLEWHTQVGAWLPDYYKLIAAHTEVWAVLHKNDVE